MNSLNHAYWAALPYETELHRHGSRRDVPMSTLGEVRRLTEVAANAEQFRAKLAALLEDAKNDALSASAAYKANPRNMGMVACALTTARLSAFLEALEALESK